MMHFSGLNFFMTAQYLAATGGCLAWLLRKAASRLLLTSVSELRLHYALLSLFGLLLLLPSPAADDFSFHPAAHVELEISAFANSPTPAAPVVVLPGVLAKSPPLTLEVWSWVALLLFFAGISGVTIDYLRLKRLIGRSMVFRRLGRVRIAVADGLVSPLSARGLQYSWILLPPSYLLNPLALRVAVGHEIQHHRSRDTLWCHLFAPLRALCFFHPLRILWGAVVAEAQELACDEVLVSQKKMISAGDYSRCLVDAAETAVKKRAGRAYAAAPSLFSERRLLARRIESMYQRKQNRRSIVLMLGLVAGSLLAASAWASGHWVIDSRINGQKMVEMAEVARKGSEFPIVVNDQVLRELNHYLGTQKGRDFISSAEAKMDRLRPMLNRQLAEHRVPEELLAVGLIESGYGNLPQSANPSQHGAGVWQFIPSTARVFGLKVDEKEDQRLDIERETDAAFRYLGANHLRFDDWLLGVMAYNVGERALENAILKLGTRDPWKLIQKGFENDEGYLAKFMAAVLIIKNRHLE